ncbi:MAG TPA: S9 family peptidase [Xanthomonadaceae bacterium]|nr:S9 family peptidase [Xanthomonadaceae bacterium]
MIRIPGLVGLALALSLTSTLLLASDGMTLRQIGDLAQVAEIAAAPDGRSVAYTRAVQRNLGDQPDGPAWTELHVSDAEGRSRAFVSGRHNVRAIAFAADGRAIHFLAKRGDDEHVSLYRIAVDGGEAERIVSMKSDIRGYHVASDGRSVLLVAREAEDAELKKLREKGFSQRIYEEDVQPFVLWRKDLSDPDSSPQRIEVEGSVQWARFSPRGDRIAVQVAPRELIDDVLMRTRVRLIDLEGGVVGEVETPGKLGDVAWSSDGRHLSLVAAGDLNDPMQGRLMVVSAEGGVPRDLLPDLEAHVRTATWRDADTIVYIVHQGVQSRLEQIRRDGSRQRVLLGGDGPIWNQVEFASGAIALTASAPSHPSELYLLARNAREPRRLTDSNPWLAEVRLAPQEVVRYQARDGLEIEGLLIRPLDEVPGRRYPLILTVHGGPEAHYSNGWLNSYSTPGQVFAARGFAVFYPNYRASTGRGVAFSKLNHGRPAAEEFDDLVDGVDHLIEVGLVDRDRVGITGGSYGGYASAWGATYYSERYAASVMFVGLSDKVAMMGTTDIPTELYHVHYLTWPWQDWEMYERASPIRYAHKSRTPTLILHGDADPRVDRSQSFAMYRYLKLAGSAPVRLVLYPGEGHGNQRAASRYDYSLRLLRWMEHYLVGEGGEPPPYALDYGLDENDEAGGDTES